VVALSRRGHDRERIEVSRRIEPELAATLAAALTRAPSPAGDGVQASAPVKRIGAVVRRARTRFG